MQQGPGCKTDVWDAARPCQLLEAGPLEASFVPPRPVRALRNLTRYRKAQIRERQREANRLHRVLEDSGIKLGCVARDILGASERAMLDALVAGTTDPELLADLARGRLRAKLAAFRRCAGRSPAAFRKHHAFLLERMLAHVEDLESDIAALSERINEQIRPFEPAITLLRTLLGVECRATGRRRGTHMADRYRQRARRRAIRQFRQQGYKVILEPLPKAA